jgi:hypothetical protein
VNACGKLPICSAGKRDFLRVQPQVVGVGQHFLEGHSCLVELAGKCKRPDVVECAQGEGALRAPSTSVVLRGHDALKD